MGSYPISNIARALEHQAAEAGRKTEESLRHHANAEQLMDHANLKSQDAYQANAKTTHMFDRATDLMVKARNASQRENDRVYQAQVQRNPMANGHIEPIAVPPSNTPFAYGQANPLASPVQYATGTVFQHNLPTPPASPQLQAVYSQVPQFADLSVSNQAHALSQQPGLSLADQARILEEHQYMQAYLAQQAQNPYMYTHNAMDQLNPMQAHSQMATEGLSSASNPVIRYLTQVLKLPTYKSFKEVHPEIQQKIQMLSSGLPDPNTMTSLEALMKKGSFKNNRRNELLPLNNHRIHLQKLISASATNLSERSEVLRYLQELEKMLHGQVQTNPTAGTPLAIETSLETLAANTKQQAGDKKFYKKEDFRQLSSYATQLAQTAEQLRAILAHHHNTMPTKKEQARQFKEVLAHVNQELQHDFANVYPEAISDNQRKQLRRKLEQSNHDIREHLKHELPVKTERNNQENAYTSQYREELINEFERIEPGKIDTLVEYEKPHLQLGDSLKVLGIGSVFSGAGYSLLKASPLKALADPFAKLAFGGTLAGSLFSALPAKFTAPIIEGDVPKAFKQLMERSHVKPQAPGRNSTSSDHTKYFFQSNW